MQKSYTKNYLKIYLWQIVSLILNLFSMFIVVPYLSSEPMLYGIYSVCISFSIFLAYADLGFIGTGQKYAAEYFAKGDKIEEIKVIGFTNFVLLIFLFLFSIFFLALSRQPELLVKGIGASNERNIASSLLLILALFTPTTLLQRLLQMIFAVRMEDFIIQRSNIVGSIFKIISVLWFFKSDNYDIVGYFLFTQFVNFISALITLFIAKKRYNYDFLALISSLKFNKNIFNKTKSLAFTSLFMTVSWILYYELDLAIIGRLLGAGQVAIYAIGLTVLSFFRSILGILFSPFNIRFNHFIGSGDESTLKSFYLQIVVIIAPIVAFPIITFAILAEPIIKSWVGPNYTSSITIVQFLVFCNILAFVTYPTSFMLLAKEKQKKLYFVNTLLPFVFWIGIVFTIDNLGIKSFAIFKFVAFVLSGITLYKIMIDYLDIKILDSLSKILLPMLFPIIFLIFSSLLVGCYLPREKSKENLFLVICVISLLLIASFGIQYFTSQVWRKQISKTVKLFRK